MNYLNDTSITYLGHATVLIETPGGKLILIDPWTIGNPACPEEFRNVKNLGQLDIILLTHIHNDHAGDAESIIKANSQAVVVCIADAETWLAKKGAINLSPMNKGGSQMVAGIEISMTHAEHSSSFNEEDGSVVYGGEAAGYVLKLENGFTIYDAGDTALFGDMALIRELYKPELALLPIGDLFTMGPAQAALAIKLLGVHQVLPIHYDTFPILTGTPAELQKLTSDIPGLKIHALKPGETLR